MNPHAEQPISPISIVQSLTAHHRLIYDLAKREIIGRYRGSVMGLVWSFLHPVLMLAVYTFVFSVIFKARWAGGSDSKTEFALVLFAGLIIFNLFSECLNRAPTLILGNTSYVKKVIFPLEVLPLVSMVNGAFHFAVSFLVWLLFYLLFFGLPPVTILWLPMILLPLILSTLGLSWMLASLGVYLRDVGQVIGVITTILMFLSPILYPISAIPEKYHLFIHLSPLTLVVEQARAAMIWGHGIDWQPWILSMAVSSLVAWLGFAWFQKTRRGFADVL